MIYKKSLAGIRRITLSSPQTITDSLFRAYFFYSCFQLLPIRKNSCPIVPIVTLLPKGSDTLHYFTWVALGTCYITIFTISSMSFSSTTPSPFKSAKVLSEKEGYIIILIRHTMSATFTSPSPLTSHINPTLERKINP